jgi:hypothetical protein
MLPPEVGAVRPLRQIVRRILHQAPRCDNTAPSKRGPTFRKQGDQHEKRSSYFFPRD